MMMGIDFFEKTDANGNAFNAGDEVEDIIIMNATMYMA